MLLPIKVWKDIIDYAFSTTEENDDSDFSVDHMVIGYINHLTKENERLTQAVKLMSGLTQVKQPPNKRKKMSISTKKKLQNAAMR